VCTTTFVRLIIAKIYVVRGEIVDDLTVSTATNLRMIKFLLSDVPDPPERPLVISYTSKAVNISWAPGVNSHNTPISQYVIYTR